MLEISYMPLIALGIAFVALVFLMTKLRLNAFFGLLIAAIIAGALSGMPAGALMKSITFGIGDTMGSLVLLITFGAMLGKILQVSGAAYVITNTLITRLGKGRIQLAILIAGFIIGIPMMYNASFLVLIPIVYTFSHVSRLPLLQLGIPLSASLSVAHGFLPPHPAPVVVAEMYNAEINTVFVYGLLFSVPAVFLTGVVLPRFFRGVDVPLPAQLFKPYDQNTPQPSFGMSLFCAVFPFLLMTIAAITPRDLEVVQVIGSPNVSLFLAVLTALYLLGIRNGKSMNTLMADLSDAASSIVMIILIIAVGGAFKQVLTDGGASNYIQTFFVDININPLVLAWLLAAVIRLLLGSATVATVTAAGIMAPIVSTTPVSKELLVLATGSGSLMFSHFNDIGFWMFKEYYNVSIKQTFQIWTVMECIVAITGLAGCLILNQFLN